MWTSKEFEIDMWQITTSQWADDGLMGLKRVKIGTEITFSENFNIFLGFIKTMEVEGLLVVLFNFAKISKESF